MRIAMLSWESLYSISIGGVAAHVSELAEALAALGHELHVFTRMGAGQRYHDCIDGVHYHRCCFPAHEEFVDEINNMCRAFVERFFVIEDVVGHFDLVHAHDWLTANAMIWIKQGRGHHCVFTVHSTEYARCGNALPGGRSERVRCQESAGTYWADRVIAVSQATKVELTRLYDVPEWKMRVVYNGVSPDRFAADIDVAAARSRYGIDSSAPAILFCGRLEWQKGPDLLLGAVPSVLSQFPETRVIYAGDGNMRRDLENDSWKMGVSHATCFAGYQRGDPLVELFKLSDGVCVPSRNEPFGIVVLEAWSAGKPVVATRNGGPNEYVTHGENGLKVTPDPEAIASALADLLSDPDRAQRMGENGHATVNGRFAWGTIATQTLDAYGHDSARYALLGHMSTEPAGPLARAAIQGSPAPTVAART